MLDQKVNRLDYIFLVFKLAMEMYKHFQASAKSKQEIKQKVHTTIRMLQDVRETKNTSDLELQLNNIFRCDGNDVCEQNPSPKN